MDLVPSPSREPLNSGSSPQHKRQPTVHWCWGLGLLLLSVQAHTCKLCVLTPSCSLLSQDLGRAVECMYQPPDMCMRQDLILLRTEKRWLQHDVCWGFVSPSQCQWLSHLPPVRKTGLPCSHRCGETAASFREFHWMARHICELLSLSFVLRPSDFPGNTHPTQHPLCLHGVAETWCTGRTRISHSLKMPLQLQVPACSQ